MDIISDNTVFKRKVIIIWSAILLSLHTVFTCLSAYDAYIRGDIMKANISNALAIILPVLALLLIYIRFGVLVSAYHSYERNTLPFTLVAVASLILTRVSEVIVYAFTYTAKPVSTGSYIFSVFSSFMIDLAVVILLLLFSRGLKERSRKVIRLILIACAFPLCISVIEETWYLINILIEIKSEYGSAVLTTAEALSAVWSFVRPVINAAAGFGIMLLTHKILKKASEVHFCLKTSEEYVS